MHRKYLRAPLWCSIAVIGSLLAAPRAASAQVTYTNRSIWEAAISGFTNLDFEGIAPPGSFATVPTPYDGVTISGTADAVDPGYSILYAWGTGAVMYQFAPLWTMTFNPGVRAVGLSFGSFAPDLFTFSINGGPASGPYAGGSKPNWAFFGVTSGVDITSITVNAGPVDVSTTVPVYDDISYSSTLTTATPEPSTIVLMATGFVGVAAARRRRRGAVA